MRDGGAIIGDILARRGVKFLFTLCGGHISPILVGAKRAGVRVVDVRDEVNAVFAADAVARMTGIPGVAAVTAGPGVTNAVTAIKNAQMAQSPVVLFGGATATLLKGRGSLQDIDQISVMQPITKWATVVKTVADLGPTVEKAFTIASSDVPGPVFVEVPVDLLYSEELVRDLYMKESGVKSGSGKKNLGTRALELYLRGHLYRQFHAPRLAIDLPEIKLPRRKPASELVAPVVERLRRAERPVLVIGSQAMVGLTDPAPVAAAVRALGIPVYLGGMARGLLGRDDAIQFRHARGKALKEADVVLIAGFPFDFRLGYGRGIPSRATLIAANLSPRELRKNRRPQIAIEMHPGQFVQELAAAREGDSQPAAWATWFDALRARERARDDEIAAQAAESTDLVNSLDFFRRLETKMSADAVLVVDGGDFVATASYIVKPRGPLSWLDPGVFGTLGVGGGFALGAALCRPGAEIWLIYGDGSCAYSLAEFDTYVRHGLAPHAVHGTDGAWAQIAREQTEMLGDDVGTVLRKTSYQVVAEGYGGVGLLLDNPRNIDATLDEAKAIASTGKPVCINVHIAPTAFRKGSMSM